jgi:hypothetical protein
MCFYTLACFKIKLGGLISVVMVVVMEEEVVVMVVVVMMEEEVVVMVVVVMMEVIMCKCGINTKVHSYWCCKHYSCKYSHSKDCYFLCFIHII